VVADGVVVAVVPTVVLHLYLLLVHLDPQLPIAADEILNSDSERAH
jgi:hypothetical protein